MSPDLVLALRLADEADAITMRHFGSVDLVVETKADRTPVSNADREAEAAIREVLRRERPDDGVVGEETGRSGGGARRWIVDPVDGTRNYVRGLPVWATLVALEEDGEVVVGVASAPALRSRWWAARGEGAYSDQGRLQVSRLSAIADATIGHAHLDAWRQQGQTDALIAITDAAYQVRGLADFWQHVLVAQGSLDAAVEPTISMWDVAAVKVIVEEAGGRFSDLAGASTIQGGNALSSNGLLHDQLLALIDSARRGPAPG